MMVELYSLLLGGGGGEGKEKPNRHPTFFIKPPPHLFPQAVTLLEEPFPTKRGKLGGGGKGRRKKTQEEMWRMKSCFIFCTRLASFNSRSLPHIEPPSISHVARKQKLSLLPPLPLPSDRVEPSLSPQEEEEEESECKLYYAITSHNSCKRLLLPPRKESCCCCCCCCWVRHFSLLPSPPPLPM